MANPNKNLTPEDEEYLDAIINEELEKKIKAAQKKDARKKEEEDYEENE